MDSTTLYLFLALVFGAVFLLGYWLFVGNFSAASVENKLLRQRLADVAVGGQNRQQVNINLLRQKYTQAPSMLDRLSGLLPGSDNTVLLIEQAGYSFPTYYLVLAGLVITCVAGVFVKDLIPLPALLLLPIEGFWLPVFVLKFLRDRRLNKFEEQLPDAIDMITRALRAGHRFNDALLLVAREFPEPLGPEFALAFEELNYGADIREVFLRLQTRMPSTSLKALLVSVLVQRDSGGTLAEILSKISAVIRGRFKFQRKVRTLTAEGRMSVWVLAAVPFVLFGVMNLTNPEFAHLLIEKPLGHKLIMAGLGLMGIGIFWINRMLKIEV